MSTTRTASRKPFNILEWLNGGRPGSYVRLGVLIWLCSGGGAAIGYLIGFVHG